MLLKFLGRSSRIQAREILEIMGQNLEALLLCVQHDVPLYDILQYVHTCVTADGTAMPDAIEKASGYSLSWEMVVLQFYSISKKCIASENYTENLRKYENLQELLRRPPQEENTWLVKQIYEVGHKIEMVNEDFVVSCEAEQPDADSEEDVASG